MQKQISSFSGFLLKAIVLFVVIAGGVATGFLVANHLSKKDQTGVFDVEPSDLLNRATLAIGDVLPAITVYDDGDSVSVLNPLAGDQKTIIAFVSKGCAPCDDFLTFLEELEVATTGLCRVVLLAFGVGDVSGGTDFEVFRIEPETLNELEIRIFPTIIGLGTDGKIDFASSGFSRVMTGQVIAK